MDNLNPLDNESKQTQELTVYKPKPKDESFVIPIAESSREAFEFFCNLAKNAYF